MSRIGQTDLLATMLMVGVVCAATPALGHTGSSAGGVVGGFAHPLFGPDHVVAMVAVGLWGAILGPPAIWLLPVTFPLVMAFGGELGTLGVPIPHVGTGIALSAVVLGAMVALALRLPLALAALMVGLFAVFHGYAHWAELPAGADPVAFSVGFVVATGLLHLAGIALGLLERWPVGRIALRATGAMIALAGIAFLNGME